MITNFSARAELENDIIERYFTILAAANVPVPPRDRLDAHLEVIITALMAGRVMIIEQLPNRPASRRLAYAFRDQVAPAPAAPDSTIQPLAAPKPGAGGFNDSTL